MSLERLYGLGLTWKWLELGRVKQRADGRLKLTDKQKLTDRTEKNTEKPNKAKNKQI